MAQCKECGSSYDEGSVSIPNPLPDYMCGKCGTQFTEESVKNLPWPYNPHAKPPGENSQQ